MEYDMDELLSVGEFASLLNTTKATLRHYDSMGVLKPAVIGDNGYRYYHPDQAQIFLAVMLFSECGLQLRDIKKYLNTFDVSHGEAIIASAERTANEKIRKLSQVSLLLEVKRLLHQASLEHEYWVPFISELPECTYFISNRLRSSEYQKTHTAHSINICRYVMDHDEFPEHPFVSRSKVSSSGSEIVLTDYREKAGNIETCTIPAGLYVSILCKGIDYHAKEAVFTLVKYAENNGYALSEDVYIVDTVNFVITQNANEFSSLFFMQVVDSDDERMKALLESLRE